MSETMLPRASTTSYHRCLFGSVSTTNALPEYRDKSTMDKLYALILRTNFTPKSISKIHYTVLSPGERKAQGAPIFHLAGPGTGGVWQLDKRNDQPRLLERSRPGSKRRAQRGQKTELHAQTSKVVVAINTEFDPESSFTSPKTDKSFGAKGYDDKNPTKKRQRASATLEGKWTLLFNAVQAAMHALYTKTPHFHFPFVPWSLSAMCQSVSGPPNSLTPPSQTTQTRRSQTSFL
ncbi:hypothetical protein P692DRAFT_20881441 [Suillus brevipes Sb2]|nr:hypothetical protein P692DRAFT_20881441 [Suillus brevipes Sb2]